MNKIFYVGVACAMCSAAFAQNLVLNGSFATDSLADWSVQDAGTDSDNFVNPSPAGDPGGSSFGWWAEAFDGIDDVIYQTINTTAGHSYTYSMNVYVDVGGPDDLNIYWNTGTFGGTGNEYSSTSLPANTWTQLSFTVVATGSTTVIGIGGYNDPAGNVISDISVTPSTPEPVSMTAVGLGALAMIRRRRNRS